jgi:hypothetical protein
MQIFSNQQESKRPTSLIIISIVSILLNAYSLANNLFIYIFYAEKETATLLAGMKEEQAGIKNVSGSEAAKDAVIRMFVNLTKTISVEMVKKLCFFTVIAALCCLIGTFLMLGLKKAGFHFFIIGTIIGTIAPFLLFGGSGMSFAIAVFMNLFWVILLWLFAARLKFMD